MKKFFNIVMEKKLYHHIFWLSLFFLYLFLNNPISPTSIAINATYTLCIMGAVYTNSLLLMPRYFKTNKFFVYILGLMFNLAVFIVLLLIVVIGIIKLANIPFELNSRVFFRSFFQPIVGSTFTLMFLELGRDFVVTQRRNQELKKNNLDTELKYLRSQLDPHLLFNVLNNIYFLIRKDQTKAEEALIGFSEMLRYQLYENKEDKIPLSQEISYVKNYISLAKLSDPDLLVNMDIRTNEDDVFISSMLLIPFIENAFKYVSHHNPMEKRIDIFIDIQDNNLLFEVTNTYLSNYVSLRKNGGIGQENLSRRLELIYPNRHTISFNKNNGSYEAKLELKI